PVTSHSSPTPSLGLVVAGSKKLSPTVTTPLTASQSGVASFAVLFEILVWPLPSEEFILYTSYLQVRVLSHPGWPGSSRSAWNTMLSPSGEKAGLMSSVLLVVSWVWFVPVVVIL